MLGWGIGLGNEYVAIGQNMQPARVIKARCESVDTEPLAGLGVTFSGHGFASAILTVGINAVWGGGNTGSGP